MIGSAYILVVLGILLAKGIGFLRDIIFASVFGATAYTDMYFQVFGLVNLIFTGIGVALSTLVIKNLNKAENSAPENQKKYVSGFITKTTVIIAAVTLVMYAAAGQISRLLLPGLDGELYNTSVKLMYIMLPSFLFVVIAYIISGVLQNNRVFFVSSIMSLPFNCVIIASLFVKNIDIVSVGIVTTIGWFLHIVIQLPSFYKKGFRLFGNPGGVKASGNNREVFYIFISNMMFQLCFMIDKAFVSSESGAATTINYASNLFITIASVFVVAMSNVVFPSISKNYEEGNREYVKSLLQYIITVMFAIFVPFILTVSCFGTNIIGLLYERGEFTHNLTETTAILFAVYTLGVFGYVCQELFNKILYLDSKYAYTVIGTIIVVALKPFLNMFAVRNGGVITVALTTTVLFTLYAVNVASAMCKVTGNYFDRELGINILKILGAGVAAFAVFAVFRLFLPSFGEQKLMFILPLGLCGIVYIGVLFISGMAMKIIKRSSDEEG